MKCSRQNLLEPSLDGTVLASHQAQQEETRHCELHVESEESDVELDMDGVIGDPNPDVVQDMGDPSKGELTDSEQEEFSNKRSEAMQLMSEVI